MKKGKPKDPSSQVFHATGPQVGQTLPTALRHWLPGPPSWGDVRRLLSTRRVTLNGNLCLDAGRRLRERDVVKVLAHPAAPLPKADDVKIRFLDAHLVVVEKPSGMTSVRHAEEQGWSAKRRQTSPTLEDLLPRIIAKKIAGGGAGKNSKGRRGSPGKQPPASRTPPVRPVHRLDRDTSGLMVFARTVNAERHLGQQFREHSTHRRYLAVVAGHVRAQTIRTQLVRDRGDGRRGSTTDEGVGKEAVTHVKPIEHLDGYTLVECRLETGRTHQIRIHMAESGHPVAGEKIYHQPKHGKPHTDTSGAPRLALHAAEIGFIHPQTGEPMSLQMPLPEDLVALVNRLRGSNPPRGPQSTG